MRMRLDCFDRRLIGSVGLLGLVMMIGHAPAQEATKASPPAPLARYFPGRDLIAYAEFDGLDAHRAAWEKTAAFRLLNETTTGAMLEQSVARLLDLILTGQSGVPVGGRDLVALGEHLLRSGCAVGLNRAGGAGPPKCLVVVIRGAAGGKARAVIDRLLGVGQNPRAKVKIVAKPGGRKVQVLGDPARGGKVWWSEGNDLVVSLLTPTGADAIIAALDGVEPNAIENPTRSALARSADEPGFVPVGLAFCDRTAFPPLPRKAVEIGLDKVRRLDYRWGFHGPALESIVGVVAPAPRTGIPALIDQPSFDARHLPNLPPGLAGFTVFSLDFARLYDEFFATMRATEPTVSRAIDQLQQDVDEAVGLKLRDELLAHLGSRFAWYTVPARVNAATNLLAGLAQGMVFVPKTAIVVDVKDHEAVAKALDTLAPRVNRLMRSLKDADGGGEVGEFKRLKGEENGRVLSLPASILPMASGLRPTLLLGRKELVLATSPATARSARDRNERPETGALPAGGPFGDVLKQMPDRLIFLGVDDLRQSMVPELLVSLPNLMEYLINRAQQGLPIFSFLPMASPSSGGPGADARRPARKLAMDPELIPEPESLRPFLFASVYMLAVDDQGIRFISREAFPSFNPATLAPAALAVSLPAFGLAARGGRSTDNLKQIGLALHNFHSTHNKFPADVITAEGKPLLSWRVRILPQLGHQALYDEFRQDEPWDSPHNKALVERMPEIFDVPNAQAEPGMTCYRGFSGDHTLFDPKVAEGVGIESITDGTSNTIGVVEAREAVPWTKPQADIPFVGDPTKLDALQALRGELGGHFPGGFHVLFLDGSVRFIKDSVNPIVLWALITRHGGEVISSDSF